MSTSNFYNKNASKIFVVNINEDNESYILDDIKTNLQQIGNPCSKYDNERSYPCHIVTEIDGGIGKWVTTFSIIIRNGYYNDANLDWSCNLYDTSKDEQRDITDDDLPRYLLKYIKAQKNKIEKLFLKNSIPLIKIATLSNGEAIYKRL